MPLSNSRRARLARARANMAAAMVKRPSPMRSFRRKVFKSKKVFNFVEKSQITSLSIPSGSFQGGILTYKANDIINWVHYEGIFDLYKLLGVKVTLVPLGSSSDVNNGYLNTTGQQGSLPMLYVAPNRDYLIPSPTNVQDIINDDGSKIIRFNKPVSFYLKNPKPDIRDSAGNQLLLQTGLKSNFWLSTGGNAATADQSAVNHYGHRWGIVNNAPGEMVVQVYVKYYFLFKEQD